jgi:ABC-type branched-subunit amino acid transport system ATPase component/branched-subunit amino acid ABC-type transport system permease component
MNAIMPFIVVGLVSGSVYGLAGTGLVLTYKTSGIFNFAYGAIGSAAAYIFYTLYVQHRLAWPVSALIAVPVLGIALGFAFEFFARRMAGSPVALQITGTVGVVVLIEAAATLIYGTTPVLVPQFLPATSLSVGGVVVTVYQILVVVIGILLTACLYAYLKWSRLGMAMRAIVDDPELLSLSQLDPIRVRRIAWIIGSSLATLSGILLAPSISLSPTELTLLVIDAFGAAAIGRFSNLPMTYAGGLGLGVVSALLTKYTANDVLLGGLPAALPFIVLFIALVLTPRSRLYIRSARRVRLGLTVPRLGLRAQLWAAVPLIVLGALVPLLFPSQILAWGSGLIFVILFGSMFVLVRVAGQVSLCQAVFMAIGASTFARLAGEDHWPWFFALVTAALVVVPIAAILAAPASRLPVLYLGLATLGFGLVVQGMFYSTNLMFSSISEGLNVARPYLSFINITSDDGYYYLLLLLTAISLVVLTALVRTRFGRVLAGFSDSPLALRTLGTDERVTRVLVFCVSASFAALAGALYAGLLGNVSDQTFDPLASLTYLVLIVIVLGDILWASFAAAVGIAVIPGYVESGTLTQYLQLAFGFFAISMALGVPQPKVPRFLAQRRRKDDRRAEESPGVTHASEPRQVARPAVIERDRRDAEPSSEQSLDARGLSVSFGGLKAVDNVSLKVRHGHITGLIGPNGAGKTTIINILSALVAPTSGRVVLGGRDITNLGTAHRARLGIGRTFQQTELFSSLSVSANLSLGAEAAMVGASPLAHLVSGRRERGEVEAAVAAAIELCDIESLRQAPASTLSTGQRRVVEVARSVASRAGWLLLDEPSAGLDSLETSALAAILRRLSDEQDIGILLVEHDMGLVMSICDYIYVLDFGELIFEGTPTAVRGSQLVRDAYLGVSATEGQSSLLDSAEDPSR